MSITTLAASLASAAALTKTENDSSTSPAALVTLARSEASYSDLRIVTRSGSPTALVTSRK